MERRGSSAPPPQEFREAFAFVGRALAEAEAHHPAISFTWGYATISLQTKKIKGLHKPPGSN